MPIARGWDELPPPDANVGVECRRLRESFEITSSATASALQEIHSQILDIRERVARNADDIKRIDATLLQHNSAIEHAEQIGDKLAALIIKLDESIVALRMTVDAADKRGTEMEARNTDFHAQITALFGQMTRDIHAVSLRTMQAERGAADAPTIYRKATLVAYSSLGALVGGIAFMVWASLSGRLPLALSLFWGALSGDLKP
jgi:hypothetical protein